MCFSSFCVTLSSRRDFGKYCRMSPLVFSFSPLPMKRPLHNPEILRHVVPQNDKTALYCHAELVEASRFSALSTYAKLSMKGGEAK